MITLYQILINGVSQTMTKQIVLSERIAMAAGISESSLFRQYKFLKRVLNINIQKSGIKLKLVNNLYVTTLCSSSHHKLCKNKSGKCNCLCHQFNRPAQASAEAQP